MVLNEGSDLDCQGASKRRESEQDSLLFGGKPAAGNDPLRSNRPEGIPNPLRHRPMGDESGSVLGRLGALQER